MTSTALAARVAKVRELMVAGGIEALLLSVGADLPYFTGYLAPQLERLTMAVVPSDGPATMLVPRLEAPKIVPHPEVFAVRPWDETENPVALAVGLIGDRRRLAVGEQTWATFVLQLQDALGDASFVGAAGLTGELRMRKDDAEIAALRRAGQVADAVAVGLADTRFSGRTERELAQLVMAMCVAKGHHVAWPPIVASGPNAASPHHEPGDRVVSAGDCVVVDFGGQVDGYYADTTRTFHVGEPADEFALAYEVLRSAQQAAVEAVRPGMTAESIDEAARSVIDTGGFGEHFIHRTGHGIGLEIHEHPYVVSGNQRVLEPGMTFTVEPGIYLPGRFGMRIEDVVCVAAHGVERLNESPRELVVVG